MTDEFDPEVLATAVERRAALAALSREPHHRDELEAELDLSKTTCHRIIRTFDERGLLRRTDSGYELTRLGEIVCDRVHEFDDSIRLAYRLQPLIEKLDAADVSFDLDLFRGVTITEPEPGDPYPFAERTMELFRESDTIRVIDCNPLIPPVYIQEMLDIALETGMRGEFVLPPDLALMNMEQFPERQRDVAESDETTGRYLVCEDIQFGLALYDDHLDLRVYDEDTGTPILYVDSDDPETIDWAESVYREYRERARPATELDDFPEWAPDSDIETE